MILLPFFSTKGGGVKPRDFADDRRLELSPVDADELSHHPTHRHTHNRQLNKHWESGDVLDMSFASLYGSVGGSGSCFSVFLRPENNKRMRIPIHGESTSFLCSFGVGWVGKRRRSQRKDELDVRRRKQAREPSGSSSSSSLKKKKKKKKNRARRRSRLFFFFFHALLHLLPAAAPPTWSSTERESQNNNNNEKKSTQTQQTNARDKGQNVHHQPAKLSTHYLKKKDINSNCAKFFILNNKLKNKCWWRMKWK